MDKNYQRTVSELNRPLHQNSPVTDNQNVVTWTDWLLHEQELSLLPNGPQPGTEPWQVTAAALFKSRALLTHGRLVVYMPTAQTHRGNV